MKGGRKEEGREGGGWEGRERRMGEEESREWGRGG